MKYCFSTLGCPDWSLREIISTARDFGYDGVEIRGIGEHMYIPHEPLFRNENIAETKKKFGSLEIPCLTSGAFLHKGYDYISEATDFINLAYKLGTPYVRVLGDAEPYPDNTVSDSLVARNLKTVANFAKELAVTVLIETNGVYANSSRLLSLLKSVFDQGCDNVGVIWDIHHPIRYFNEQPEETYQTLKKYIKHVHIKDSVMENGNVAYKMIGEGDIPIQKALYLLAADSFQGFVSLEWVKRWCGDLEEPGVVFMHFLDVVRGTVA